MRRRLPWIAAGVVVLVAAILLGGRAWIRGQDHLEFGGISRYPDGASVRETDLPEPGEPETVAVVDYRDGAPMRFGFSVRNTGRFKVRVTEVARPEAPDETVFMFRPTGARMASAEDVPANDDAVPFRPFSLEPGHQRYVEVVGRLGDCEYWEAGSAESIVAQDVRYEVWKQSLTESITLNAEIRIRLRSRADCPRPQVRD